MSVSALASVWLPLISYSLFAPVCWPFSVLSTGVPESGSFSSMALPLLLLWAVRTLLGLQKRIMVWTGLGCGPFSPMDSRTRRAFTPSWAYHGLGET